MAQYATTTDLTNLGIPAAALAGIGTPEQNAALVAASVTIDSYVGTRFKLPLASFGGDIIQACAAIAAWTLMVRRGLSPGNDAWETLRTAQKDAMSWLKDVSGGRAVPAFPVAKDTNSFNPESAPFVITAPCRRGW